MTKLTFVDKTLSFALKQKRIDIRKFLYLKEKIPQMSNTIFDIPYEFAAGLAKLPGIDFDNIRVCIGKDTKKIDEAYEMGFTRIKALCGNINEKTKPEILKVFERAFSLNVKLSVGCIDISKDLDDIYFYRDMAKKYKFYSLVIHDKSNSLDPLDTSHKLLELKKILRCRMEYGGKNLLGLATGNALGAVKSGIDIISTAIGGMGNFPAFEEVIMGLNHLLDIDVNIPKELASKCKEIMDVLDIDLPRTKPIIGTNIFMHESGIHVDGVIKKSDLYEPFTPEEVGLSRKIVIGKHSGKAAVLQKINELNIKVNPLRISLLLEKVRSLAVRQKAAVIDEQLKELAREVEKYESAYC